MRTIVAKPAKRSAKPAAAKPAVSAVAAPSVAGETETAPNAGNDLTVTTPDTTTDTTPDTTDVPANSAKPADAAPAAKPADLSTRRDERAAAGAAVAAYYHGKSLPFKSASDTFKPLNFDNAKAESERQAALMLCLYVYGAGNIQPDGTFVRGAFRVPGSVLGRTGTEATELFNAQPESGCLGNMLGRTVHFVSGATAGKMQREQILRIDHAKARREIVSYFGERNAKIVDSYTNAEPAQA